MTFANTDKFYIKGAWVTPAASATLPVLNPAANETIATLAMGASADMDQAVAAAKVAFESWSQSTKQERLALLRKILKIYNRRYDEFAAAISMELGAPIDFSKEQQAAVGTAHLEALMQALETFEFEETQANGDLLVREPIGVCGMITPLPAARPSALIT